MAEQQARSPHASQAEYWNSAASRAWADQHQRQDRALAGLAAAALDLAAPQQGESVLDIGCGSGTTVLELAARVGTAGHVLGADISEHSVARARERIAAAGFAACRGDMRRCVEPSVRAEQFRSRLLAAWRHVFQRPDRGFGKCASGDAAGGTIGARSIPPGKREPMAHRAV